MLPTESSQTKAPAVYVHLGLEGLDDDIEILQAYFRQMQKMTVETSMHADIDLLTFALGAHYFGVIMAEGFDDEPEHPTQFSDSCLWRDPEPSSRDLDDAELVELNIPPPITVQEFLALPEEEKLRRWNEAWEDKRKDCVDAAAEDRTPSPRGRVSMPGGIDHYLPEEDFDGDAGSHDGKGKMREPGVIAPWAHSRPVVDQPIPASVNDHLINWPEDGLSDDNAGPPSSNEDFYFISETESPAPFVFPQFMFPGGPPPPVDPNFGREYFEPDTEPPLKLPPIPDDPIEKKAVREAANRKVDELRGQTVRLFEMKQARLARSRLLEARDKANGREKRERVLQMDSGQRVPNRKPIGLVYVTSSQNFWDPLHKGECNIGLYVAPEYRTLDRLLEALHRAIEDAFHNQDCHRLQAVMVDNSDILDFLSLYTSAGFRQEGIRRRAFFSQIAGEWKDVTYLAILATEWIHDRSNMGRTRLLPRSLWDEILSRHQREQEEFIRKEEQKLGTWPGRLHRSSSVETVRALDVPTAMAVDSGVESSGFTTDDGSSYSSSSSSVLVSRRKRVAVHLGSVRFDDGAIQSSSESGFESEWEMADADDGDFFSGGIH